MRITTKLLEQKGACAKQVTLFSRLFPDGCVPTLELCLVHADQFDWGWAAEHLLGDVARSEYDRACDVAWSEYDRACLETWSEYDRPTKATWSEYDRSRHPARACRVARSEYNRACAIAFATGCARDARPIQDGVLWAWCHH